MWKARDRNWLPTPRGGCLEEAGQDIMIAARGRGGRRPTRLRLVVEQARKVSCWDTRMDRAIKRRA
jgi:transcriptional/translational regulatory protein YebC/TACO1